MLRIEKTYQQCQSINYLEKKTTTKINGMDDKITLKAIYKILAYAKSIQWPCSKYFE